MSPYSMSKLNQIIHSEIARRNALIKKWLKEGVSKTEIAKRLGISRQRVYVLCLRLIK